MNNQHYIPSGDAAEKLDAFIKDLYDRPITFHSYKLPKHLQEKLDDLLDTVYAAGQANG